MTRRTHVYEYHKKHGNIVEYAGFDLPVWFEGIVPECRSVRNSCGMFDVSHMGRVLAEGKGAESFLNQLTTNDVSKLAVGRGQDSLLCNPKGGIMDDLTIFRTGSMRYLVVYNAGNRDKNWNWLLKNRPRNGVTLSDVSDNVAMFAVQGPRAGVVLWNVSGVKLEEVEKYGTRDVKVAGIPCLLTRSGYTGEDGFEIYVWNTSVKEPSNAMKAWEKLLSGGREVGISPVGLGARDVLRLEAGMCLYGNDIDENTSPVEAKLNWVVRVEKPDFVGKNGIIDLKHLSHKAQQDRSPTPYHQTTASPRSSRRLTAPSHTCSRRRSRNHPRQCTRYASRDTGSLQPSPPRSHTFLPLQA